MKCVCYYILFFKVYLIAGQNIASFHNNQWNNIGRFERFEIGVELPDSIDQQIEDFLNNQPGINPYNFKEILLEGVFTLQRLLRLTL